MDFPIFSMCGPFYSQHCDHLTDCPTFLISTDTEIHPMYHNKSLSHKIWFSFMFLIHFFCIQHERSYPSLINCVETSYRYCNTGEEIYPDVENIARQQLNKHRISSTMNGYLSTRRKLYKDNDRTWENIQRKIETVVITRYTSLPYI